MAFDVVEGSVCVGELGVALNQVHFQILCSMALVGLGVGLFPRCVYIFAPSGFTSKSILNNKC